MVKLSSYGPEFANEFLRFSLKDIERIINVMDLPEYIILENRSKVHREEFMIRGLFEFSNDGKKSLIALALS
jgi:hypothetical protein